MAGGRVLVVVVLVQVEPEADSVAALRLEQQASNVLLPSGGLGNRKSRSQGGRRGAVNGAARDGAGRMGTVEEGKRLR